MNKSRLKHKKDNKVESKKETLILKNYIFEYHQMSIEEFSEHIADHYINDPKQKEFFLRKGIWLKVKLNYIAGLILTSRGKKVFSPKELRKVIISELVPSLSEMSNKRLSSLILTQDVHKESNKEYNNGNYCLKKIDRGLYKFIGFE